MKIFKSIHLLIIIFTLFLHGCTTDKMILLFEEPVYLTDGLVSITVTPDDSLIPLGYSLQYTAKGNYLDGSIIDLTDNVTWTSHETNIAKVSNTSDSKGFTTTHNIGSTIVTAAIKSFSGNANITVIDKVMDHITINPSDPSVALGIDQQFTATLHYSDASTQDVTGSTSWSSSNTSIATINLSGFAESILEGSTTITADYNGEIVSTTLTVTDKDVHHITISPINPSVALGVDPAFTATAHYTDGSTDDVTTSTTWTSSNTSVANINPSGVAETLSTGTTTITAVYDGESENTTLTVTDKEFHHLTISPINPSVALGVDPAFTATAHYTDGSTDDVTTSTTWTSSNTSVANINASGIADTLSTGTTTITAVYEGESENTTLTVADKELIAIDINPPNASIAQGLTVQYTAMGHYTDGSTDNITILAEWASYNTGIASFSGIPGDEGLAQGVSPGTTSITASLDGIDEIVQIEITQKELLSIEVTPVGEVISISGTLQYTATGLYTDSSTDNITNSVTWASTNTGTATISGTGLATALAVGATEISATMGVFSDSTSLTVSDNTPPMLEMVNVVSSHSLETQVMLFFSEDLDASTANINGNYGFDLMGYGTSITSASLQADNSQVLVTLNPGLAPGMHEAWVINVEDLEGNAIINNGIDNNIPFFINPPDELSDGPVFVDPFFDGTRSAKFEEYDNKIYLGANDAASKLFEMDKSFISIQNIRLDADGNQGAPFRKFNGYLSKYSGCNFWPCYDPINGVDTLYAACTGGSSTPDLTGGECAASGGIETFFIGAFNTIGDYHSYWITRDVSSSKTTFTFQEKANPDPGGSAAFRSFNMYVFKEQLWNHYGAEFDGGGRGARICMKLGGCNDGTAYLDGSQPLLYWATRIGAKPGVPLRNGSHRGNTFGGQVPLESQVLKGIDFMHEYDQDDAGPQESQLYIANGGFYAGPLGAPRVNTSDGGILRTKPAYSSKSSLPPSCPENSSGCLAYWEDVTPDNNSDWNNYMSIMLPQNSAVTGEGNCSTSDVEMDCTEPYNVITSSLKAIPSMRPASNGDLYLIRNACSVNTVCLNGKADCDFRTVKQTCPPGSEVPQLWMMPKNCGDAASCASAWTLVAEFGLSGKSNMQGNSGDCGSFPNKCSANRQITLLEVVGSYLYIGFDNPDYGVNIWRTDMSSILSGSTPVEGNFKLVNDFGLNGKVSNKKLFSYMSYSDSSDDWMLVATGNGINPVEVYRTSNDGDL